MYEDGRPEIDPEWPYEIRDMLQMCFAVSPDKRPVMEFMFESIRDELKNMRDGDDSKLRNSYLLRRRSMASMKNLQGVKKQSRARKVRSNLASSINKIGQQIAVVKELRKSGIDEGSVD